MSRILRRPMFRGGRVDSRGTGITSGLGYEKGGRVGYADAGVVTGGGLMANNIFSGTPRTKDYLEKQQFYQKYKPKTLADITADYNKMMQQKEDDLLMTMGIDDYSGFQDKVAEDLSYYRDPQGGMMKYFQEAKAKDDAARADATKYDVTIEEVINNQIKNNNTRTGTGTGTGEPSSDDLLNIDKEKFAELLGSNKARGEDISNMLMSFAGKALKPEATVKGAFGEFFEEEAKRPSSKTKIDQAAAQLAINKYIKGEISKQELAKLMAVNSAKANLGDAAYIATALSKGGGFANGVKDGIQMNPQRKGNIPVFEEVTSEQMTEENFTPGPEDIGKVFIETDTRKVYEYKIEGNKIVPVPIYSR